MLDNKYALLFIRGERPIKDLKYNMLKHPNVKFTANGEAKPYEHGTSENAICSIKFDFSDIELQNTKENEKIQQINSDYKLLSEEEVEKYIKENL